MKNTKTMRWNRIISRLLVLCMLAVVAPAGAFASERDVVIISEEADLVALARDCALDTYSQGLTVLLSRDIQVGDDFRGIPTFGGTFNGRGHTISGLNMSHEGSTYGLFRYIQEEGLVQNLKVEVNLQLTGTQSRIGGIAGENRGLIENCNVYGIVSGKNHIGGIAAVNEESGRILDCTFMGTLTGENFSGGIVGENYGLIKACINQGAVNTTVTEATLHLEDLHVNITEIDAAEDIVTATNSGGIAGFNRGIIEDCTNEGVIGYPHVGYNVGGIAGRQDGYIGGSVNRGTVFGRKDVGGIVGQMEPYQVLKYKEDFFRKLEKELDVLQDDIKEAYDQVEESSDAINNQLNRVNDSVEAVSDRLEALSDQTIDYADKNIQTINDTLDRIDQAVVDLKVTSEELKNATEDLSTGMKHLGNGCASLAVTAYQLDKGIGKVGDAFSEIGKAADEMNEGASQMALGFEHLDAAVANNEPLDQAIAEINSGMTHMNNGFDAATATLASLPDTVSNVDEIYKIDINETVEQMADDMDEAQASFDLASAEMEKALAFLQEEYEEDSQEVSVAMTYFSQSAAYFDTALNCLGDGIEDMEDSAAYFEKAVKSLQGGMSAFTVAASDLEQASDHLTLAADQVSMILDREAAMGAPQFSLLEEDVEGAARDLHAAGDGLVAEITRLNDLSKAYSDDLTADLEAVNDQLFVVVDLIQEGYENLMDDDKEIFIDISDDLVLEEDADSLAKRGPTFGYVVNCQNTGAIEGDINVGGISGTLAIDYDFDPEGDVTAEDSASMDFQFQTKGVLGACQNTGAVTAKKDYAGGIVGRMDLGSLYGCFNQSAVVSDDGSYVGGIAGGSYASIRNSYSLSSLSGLDYIGGIAGFGTEIDSCTALVSFEQAEEFIGAIAGDVKEGMSGNTGRLEEADEDENEQPMVSGNVFVGGDQAAIDGISYAGLAEQAAYEDLLADPDLPAVMRDLKLTFVADGKIVREQAFAFGEGIEEKDLPAVPNKPGYAGAWPDYDYDHLTFPDRIEAEYTAFEQVLASKNGQPAELLVEGSFSPNASLSITLDHEVEEELLTDMTKISQHHIRIRNNEVDNDGYSFRYYLPYKKDYQLFAWVGSGWQQLDTVRDGSYMVFQWPQEDFVLTVYEAALNLDYVIGAAALALILAILLVLRRKRKKRRTAKKAAESPAETVEELVD